MDKISKGINVLMIGSDLSILKEGSESFSRMKEYGTLVNRLDIAVFNGKIRGPGEDVFKISPNVFVHPRSFLGMLRLFNVSYKKLSFVLDHRIDIVTSQDPFWMGYLAMRLSKWLRAGLQIQIHTDLFSPYFRRESFKNRVYLAIARRVIPRAGSIRVVSERIRGSLKEKFSLSTEPMVLPVRVNDGSFSDPAKIEELKKRFSGFEKIILMISRFTSEKNVGMAIAAMRDAVKRFPKAGLVIVGDGPLRRNYELQIKNYKLEGNVKLEGWTDDPASYYKVADLFLNTSDYEGYCRTIVESLICGTPVITTDVGSAPEYVKNGENGFIIPVRGGKELSSALIEFLGDDELAARLKKGAFSIRPKIMAKDEYLEMYARGWLLAMPR